MMLVAALGASCAVAPLRSVAHELACGNRDRGAAPIVVPAPISGRKGRIDTAAMFADALRFAVIESFGGGRRLRDRRQADELRAGRTGEPVGKVIGVVVAAEDFLAAFVAA